MKRDVVRQSVVADPNSNGAVEPSVWGGEGAWSPGMPMDAPILTTTGWKHNIDLVVGERVIDPCGGESKVIGVHPGGATDVYRIALQDGTAATASGSHLWQIQTRDSNSRQKLEIVSTAELKQRAAKKYWQVLLPKPAPFEFEPSGELPVHPYLLGVLLAEGSLSDETLTFASNDEPIIQRVASLVPEELSIKSIGVKHRISSGNWAVRRRPEMSLAATALSRPCEVWVSGAHGLTRSSSPPYICVRVPKIGWNC